MAELQINKRYMNEAELGGDLFRQTSFYSDKALEAAFNSGFSFDLGKTAFENRDKDLSSIGISMNDYNYLSGIGQMTALETAFNISPYTTNKDENGNEYNVRDTNIAYLKAEIEQAKNQETYDNTNWFLKFMGSGLAALGNFGAELYGTVEGLLDAGATIINFFANDDTITEWIAQDTTGYNAVKNALSDFNAKYTFVGHDPFMTFIYDFSGVGGMLIPAIVPGIGAGATTARVGLNLGGKAMAKATTKAALRASRIGVTAGRTAYWGSMAGHTAETAADYSIKNNTGLTGFELGGYTASVMAVELATEFLGGKIFGSSAMDRIVLGKLTSPLTKVGSKLSTKSTIGALSYRAFGDILGEGVEEMAAEWADGLLWANMITGNPEDQASITDVLYAGLLGGAMGGVLGGARLAKTQRVSITRDGNVVLTSSLNADEQKTAVNLTKAQTILLSDNLINLNSRLAKELDFQAQAREGYITQENAKELTENQNKKLIQTAAGLSNFFSNLGDEEFKKSFDLLNGSIEQQAQSIRNFVNRTKPETKIYKELVDEYNKRHPLQSIDIIDTPSIEAQRIQKYISNKFGVNVVVLKTGAQDGVHEVVNGVTLNEYTIGFREGALKDLGVRGVLNTIIVHELAHTLQMNGGAITAKDLLKLKYIIDDEGFETTSVNKSLKKVDLKELSEAQADAIAQALLFDDRAVEKIMFNNRNIFARIYNWMKKQSVHVRDDKTKNKNKNVETYKILVRRMAAYRKTVANNVGNKEDADKYIRDMSLTELETKELLDTYLPTWRTENCSITKYDLNTATLDKMTALNILASVRKDKTDQMFDFSQAFNVEYYDADFVSTIMNDMPNTSFKEAVQTFVFSQTGYVINNDGWIVDGKNIINDLNENFVNDLISGTMLDPRVNTKYPTLHQLLNRKTQALFLGKQGSSASDVRVVFKNSVDDKTFDADYNYVTKTLTLTIPNGDIKTKIKRAGFEQQLQRCVALAIADVHSFYGGLVPIVVQQSLNNLTATQFDAVSKRILTDDFLAIQTNKQELIDAMMFKIVELTTPQRILDDNSSGFLTDGLKVQGYGDFFDINFAVAGAIQNNETVTKMLQAINEQVLTIAYKTYNKQYFEKNKYDPTKVVPGQQKFEMTDKEVKPTTNVINKEQAAEYKKQVRKNKREKQLVQPKKETVENKQPKETIKSEQPKETVKSEQPKEQAKTVTAPNERSEKLIKKIKDFEFSEKYLSQVQKIDSIKEDDKYYAIGSRQEFIANFSDDLNKIKDDDVKYYIEYYTNASPSSWTVSSKKTFWLLIEYINNNRVLFTKETRKMLQQFLMTELNINVSVASSYGHMFTAAQPLKAIERQMLQEGIEFEIPDVMKDRWIDAARSGDIETQTQVETRIAEMAREKMHQFPRTMRFMEKGISKDERRKRFNYFIDKINAFRYLAMLSNPATHIRNIVSNAGIKAMARMSEGFEQLFNKFIKFDENDLKYLPDTKVSKEDIAYVDKRFSLILDSVSKAGKYDTRVRTDASHLMDNLRTEEIFGTEMFKKLQTLIYDKSLSKMDAKFSRPELARVLTQLLVANYPKQFEYDKAHYDKDVGTLFKKIRPFEDILEAYDINYDKKQSKLLAERDIYLERKDNEKAKEVSDKLSNMGKVYSYVNDHISKIGVGDTEFLKSLLEVSTKEDAEKAMRDYRKTHKDVETLAQVKQKIKVANDAMESAGLTNESITKMFDVATRKVLTNYLRYENRAFKNWCKIMESSLTAKILGTVFIPFAKVVTNMTILIYQYSPLNLLRGIKNFAVYARSGKALPEITMDYKNTWHNFVTKLWYGVDDARFIKAQSAEDLAKGTLGTMLLIFGTILAELGIIEKDDDDEKYGGYIIHLFGTELQIKLSDFAPSITPLIAGAALMTGAKKEGFGGALANYWQEITEDTLYGSFNSLFESYGDSIMDKLLSMGQTYFSQYVPAILRSLQKLTNNKKAVDYSNPFTATWQRVISAIPFVSGWVLPDKIDPYTGKPEKAYNSGWLAFLNIFSPVSVSADKTDAIRKNAQALNATTTGATGKITINDIDYNLKGSNKADFQSNRAKYVNQLITEFTNNKTKVRVQQEDGTFKELTYSQMTDAEKQTAFKSYYSKATNYAKIKYWVSNGHKYVTSSRDEYDLLRKLGINATYRIDVKGSKYKD